MEIKKAPLVHDEKKKYRVNYNQNKHSNIIMFG